jgi:hypothetical protein
MFLVARHVVLPLSVRKWTWFLVRCVTVPTRSFSSVQGTSSGQVTGRRILFVILMRSPAFSVSTLTVGGGPFLLVCSRSLSRRAILIRSCLTSCVSSSMSMKDVVEFVQCCEKCSQVLFAVFYSFCLETMLYRRSLTVARQIVLCFSNHQSTIYIDNAE